MALRADELGFELALRWMLLICERGCGECERRHPNGDSQQLHFPSARLMPSSSIFWVAGPMMWGDTTRPRRSMKKVSG
jgi:hypothetical protein